MLGRRSFAECEPLRAFPVDSRRFCYEMGVVSGFILLIEGMVSGLNLLILLEEEKATFYVLCFVYGSTPVHASRAWDNCAGVAVCASDRFHARRAPGSQ